MTELRVPFEEMLSQYRRVLLARGMAPKRAELCARLVGRADLDGVYTHGLRRFGGLIRAIDEGRIDPNAEPVRLVASGALEQWDGRRGPGNLSAYASMGRAIELARAGGMGCVALRNGNHWLRAGTYGWQAAEAGCIGICWTNTIPNVPPWGAKQCRVGNNPLVFAVPRPDGHVVLDMAMSQFSWGKLAQHRSAGTPLPVPGGYDEQGRLTLDAAEVLRTNRLLPAGLWKGSGLALMLDLLAAVLSGGAATWQLAKSRHEHAVSQIFLAFDPAVMGDQDQMAETVNQAVEFLTGAAPASTDGEVLYPGQRALRVRRENTERGIPVDPDCWQHVLEL
ncbi:hypothetical protein LCGC14_1158240 [marine sediment metagenome]|uniref:3-dehydro-L-gulonate 2-dehydrogenase n=1 Tax=marine sediment metagenome TaxID=412755 RepID=A0A0F9PBQ9_9ZZZZ